MSSPLTPTVYASAARALGWPPTHRIATSDIPTLISHLHLDVRWLDTYVMVQQRGGPGHVERINPHGLAGDTLFTAIVMCAALIGDAA